MELVFCMSKVDKETVKFSKIILGTAQLGMPYGEGKWRNELMSKVNAFSILEKAWQNGISTLDTSPNYGCAEIRIAEFLDKNPAKNFHIISKIKDLPDDDSQVDACFDSWLQNNPYSHLNNCLTLSVLLHKETDLNRSAVVKKLNRFKSKSIISSWGVSIYNQGTVEQILKIPGCEIVQLPFSILAQEFGREFQIERLSVAKKNVIARSVFVRGHLFKGLSNRDYCKPPASSKNHEERAARKKAALKIAIDKALKEPGINNLVLGADFPSHITEWVEVVEDYRKKQDVVISNNLISKV